MRTAFLRNSEASTDFLLLLLGSQKISTPGKQRLTQGIVSLTPCICLKMVKIVPCKFSAVNLPWIIVFRQLSYSFQDDELMKGMLVQYIVP